MYHDLEYQFFFNQTTKISEVKYFFKGKHCQDGHKYLIICRIN
jgi:hypothetical protein